MDFAHVPVLPEQCMRLLNIQENGPRGFSWTAPWAAADIPS